MKLLKVFGSIIVCLILILVVLRITGLDPHGRMPGLWLSGNLVTTPVTDWSIVTPHPIDQVQTRSWYLLPHSVNTNFVVLNGQVYLTSVFQADAPFPASKGWTSNIIRDPRVRLKFGDQLYDCRLIPVSDSATLEKLLPLANEKYPGMRKAYADKTSTVHFFQAMPL